jgi:hypothetical protein
VQADDAGMLVDAMSIAMSHPAISQDPAILCAAACTCTALRQAVQQCSASIAITLQLTAPLAQLQSFKHWLPKHAALVDSISAKADASSGAVSTPFTIDSTLWQPHVEAAQQLLEQALQSAGNSTASVAATGAPAAAAAAAASTSASTAAQPVPLQRVQQQQEHQGLQLSSFSSNSSAPTTATAC